MKITLTKNEITELAGLLASAQGAYFRDKDSAYPLHFYICDDAQSGLYVDGCFDYTPKTAVAYIVEMREPPEFSAKDLASNFMDVFIAYIENAEWDDDTD